MAVRAIVAAAGQAAGSEGGANIKVASREGVLENSVGRFLGHSSEYIQQIAKENLEANCAGSWPPSHPRRSTRTA
ncbi:hypothetical protein BH23ACT9_BH23ACT9_02190 [soil metagenome]